MAGDQATIKTVITNRKARFEFEILDRVEAGIVLTGTEVKSVRDGKISLQESYASARGSELWLEGCTIQPYAHGNINNHEPTRPRKLLLHRRELDKLLQRVAEKGLTLVPISVYFKGNRLKVEIGVARGKKLHDKRETSKARDVERSMRRGEDA
jgi:SsrA-binding protein